MNNNALENSQNRQFLNSIIFSKFHIPAKCNIIDSSANYLLDIRFKNKSTFGRVYSKINSEYEN